MIKNKIEEVLQKQTGLKDVTVDIPEKESFGDYSSNIVFKLEGDDKGKVSSELAEKLKTDTLLKDTVEKIEVVGGFINFFASKKALYDNLKNILEKKDEFGSFPQRSSDVVVVDYSSPNIAKRFSIGHLRSTIIGQALKNLYQKLGYRVIGDNHLGDWGTQFGKILYMIDREKPADLNIDTLEELYVRFHKEAEGNSSLEESGREWFKKLEEKDKKATEIWKKCIEVSMDEFEKIYSLLGVKFDYAYGESFYGEMMEKIIKDARDSGIAKKSRGALVIEFNDIKTPLMLVKNDGATTYATRDLAAIKFRMNSFKPKIIIYEVGAEQELYFRQVFKAARLLGYVDDSVALIHTKHGMYLSEDGKKFRTREGGAVKLEEVLSEAIEKAKKLGSKTDNIAKMVGVGAIVYFDLMHAVGGNIVFDWKKVLALEGNSGPYIQYVYARCQSVVKKSEKNRFDFDKDLDLNVQEESLLKSLLHFTDVLEIAARRYSPNLLCNYLYDLSSKYNTFYNECRILNTEDGKKGDLRLAITEATGVIIKEGLRILGIQAPASM